MLLTRRSHFGIVLYSVLTQENALYTQYFVLQLSDQISLLRLSWSELFVLNVAQSPTDVRQLLTTALRSASGTNGGLGSTSDRMEGTLVERARLFGEQVDKLKELNIDPAEFSCLKAIVLFCSGDIPAMNFVMYLIYCVMGSKTSGIPQ